MKCLHLAPPFFYQKNEFTSFLILLIHALTQYIMKFSCGILHNLNSTAVNEDIFIKNLQGGTFAFAHLFLQT
jgi:hypothetical protein